MARYRDGHPSDQNGSATGGVAGEDMARDRLDRLVWQTRLLTALEHLAPPVVNVGAAFAGFYGLAWLGVFALLPLALAWLPLAGLAGLCALALWPLRRFRWPSRQEALSRLDASSGLANRPLSSFADQLAATGRGPDTDRLWQIHLQRLAAQIKVVVRPRLNLDQAGSDPYALRHLGILLLVMGFFAADRTQDWSLMSALSQTGPSDGVIGLREDGWIDPPAYTQVPPIILALHNADHHTVLDIKAPVGSKLVIRRSDGRLIKVDWQGGLAPENDQKELRFALHADALLTLHLQGQRDVTVKVSAIPDRPPLVTMTEPPKPDRKEGLGLSYHWEDDYGIVSGALEIVGALGSDQSLETHPPLLPPPNFPFSVSPDPRQGDGKMRLPLEEHAWGGVEVEARFRVRDDLGQIGESEPVRLTLPQRGFAKPLARALIEQRRALIVNPSQALKIREAVLALMIAPELFTPRLSIYLGLQRIERGLVHKKQSADQYIAQLIETADLMWAMALAIEDDGLSNAQQALQAAQNALKEAIDRGASPEELKQLTEELRRAMDQAMREMAENMLNDNQAENRRPFDPKSMQMITPRDLKSLTDRMEEAMRRGDMAEAQRLLEQLKNITRNMQAARPRSQQQSEMDKALDDLDQMSREQQELRDRTFREGQQGRNSDQKKNLKDLEQNQQALRDRLEQLRRSMRQRGADQKEFGEAEDAMRDAEGALGQGQDGEAVDAQGRALEAMRKGGESLSQQMQQNGEGMGMGDGSGDPNQMADGPDQGQSGDQQADGQGNGERDPLGRGKLSREANDRAKLNDDGSRTAAEERARNLIEELRRRLGEVARPQAEIDYLQRLLKENGLH